MVMKDQRPVKKFEKRYFSPLEVARYFAISKDTVYRMINDGEIAACKVRCCLRIPASELRKYEKRIKEAEY